MAQYWMDMRPTTPHGADVKSSVPSANTGQRRACGKQVMSSAKIAGAMEPSVVLNAMSGLTVSTRMTGYSS